MIRIQHLVRTGEDRYEVSDEEVSDSLDEAITSLAAQYHNEHASIWQLVHQSVSEEDVCWVNDITGFRITVMADDGVIYPTTPRTTLSLRERDESEDEQRTHDCA